jgi:hypothetical protein
VASRASVNFKFGKVSDDITLRLNAKRPVSTSSEVKSTYTNPLGLIPVDPHTKLIKYYGSETIIVKTTGSIAYDVDLSQNNGDFTIHFKDRGARYCASKKDTTGQINLLDSIQKIIARNPKAFSKDNRDLFLYNAESKTVAYNIPFTATTNILSYGVKYEGISLK